MSTISPSQIVAPWRSVMQYVICFLWTSSPTRRTEGSLTVARLINGGGKLGDTASLLTSWRHVRQKSWVKLAKYEVLTWRDE